MSTTFTQLNDNWNAEPNAPDPKVRWEGGNLHLSFYMNPFQFPEFEEGEIREIIFTDCARYRIGCVNDEGWYRGQCRFSKIVPSWGEFYEVGGDIRLNQIPDDWISIGATTEGLKHFLFYFRDKEFECDARDWSLTTTIATKRSGPLNVEQKKPTCSRGTIP